MISIHVCLVGSADRLLWHNQLAEQCFSMVGRLTVGPNAQPAKARCATVCERDTERTIRTLRNYGLSVSLLLAVAQGSKVNTSK